MQQTYQCPACGSPVAFGARFCGNCGTQLSWPTQQQIQPPPVYQQQQQPRKWSQQSMSVPNTSGQGKGAIIPPEIKGWNWGAFLLNLIWGIGNSVWISLLCLIPYAALVMSFVLGAKGNEWAWQSRRWDSVEHFRKTQRTWRNWGIGLLIVSLLLYTVLFIVGFFTNGQFMY